MCHLTLLYSRPLCWRTTCALAPQRGGVAAKHFHKGAQRQRGRCLRNRQTPVHIVYAELKSFSVRRRDQWVKKLTRSGSGTFLSRSESLARRRPSAWMNSTRPSPGKPADRRSDRQAGTWTRGVIAARGYCFSEAAKASAAPKAEGESKICFHSRWRHVLCLLKIQANFLDLNQMLRVMRTPSVSAYPRVSDFRAFSSRPCQLTTCGSVCFLYTFVAEFSPII